MESLFLKLLNMSLTSCFLIIAVMLLRPIIKKTYTRITLWLWGIVALRLICPFSIESILSLLPSREPIPMNIATAPTPTVDTGVDFLDTPINSFMSESLTPSPWASVNPMQILISVLTALWLLGICIIAIYSFIKYMRLHKKVKASILLEDNIYICDNIKTPFILGIFKAKIYISSSLNPIEVAFVTAHEKSHIRHLDHILKPLGFVILMLHWFNPLVWVSFVLFCKDIELACDERVIKSMSPDDKKDYSKTLLNLSAPARIFFSEPLAFGEVGVKSRIKLVLSYKKPTLWAIIAAVILSIVLCLFFLTDPKQNAKKSSSGEPYFASGNSTNCEGVTVELSEMDLLSDPPILTVSITNKTGKDISYGEQFELYHIENNKKVDCFTGNEKYWHEILNLLQGEKGTHTVSIKDYDISKAGVYLLEFKFTVGDEEFEKYTASVEFAINNEEAEESKAPAKPEKSKETAEFFETSAIAYAPSAFYGRFVAPPTVQGKKIIKIQNQKLYINSESLGTGSPLENGVSADSFISSLYSTIDNEVTWVEIGKLTETTLTKENFDDHFIQSSWILKYSASGFRYEAKKAWRVDSGNMSYRIVKYGAGDYFLTYEYISENETYIYYLFLLRSCNVQPYE